MFAALQTAAGIRWLTPQPGVSDPVWKEGQELPPVLHCNQVIECGAGWVNFLPIDLGNAGEEYSFTVQGSFPDLLARKQFQRLLNALPRSGTLVLYERDPTAGTPTWKVWNGPGTTIKPTTLPAPTTGGLALKIQYTAMVPQWVPDNDYIPSLRGVALLDGANATGSFARAGAGTDGDTLTVAIDGVSQIFELDSASNGVTAGHYALANDFTSTIRNGIIAVFGPQAFAQGGTVKVWSPTAGTGSTLAISTSNPSWIGSIAVTSPGTNPINGGLLDGSGNRLVS